MACNCLKTKGTVILAVLFFIFRPISVYALNSTYITLSSTQQEQNFGGFSTNVKYSVELATATGYTLCIYNKDNKLISNANVGKVSERDFPIRIGVNTKDTGKWRIDINFEELEEDKGNILDRVQNSIDNISDKIKYLNDYLTNPNRMEQGVTNMKNAFNDLQKKIEPSEEVQSSLKNLGNVSTSSSAKIEPINVEFAKGVKFNVFDLSKFSKEIKSIRMLMSAVIWIEFAMFCIRIVVPKFKV